MAVPQHHALAPTQGQSSFPFTMEGTCGAVGVGAEVAPWRRWIRQRTDWERIVGEGMVAIELRRLLDMTNT